MAVKGQRKIKMQKGPECVPHPTPRTGKVEKITKNTGRLQQEQYAVQGEHKQRQYHLGPGRPDSIKGHNKNLSAFVEICFSNYIILEHIMSRVLGKR